MDIESLPPVSQTLSDEEDEERKAASVAPIAASTDQHRAVQAHTAETLPVSKLLNYVKKLDLIAFVGPTQYAAAEQSLRESMRESLGKPNITVKDVKKLLAANAVFVARLRESPLGNRAFAKYRDAVSRLKEADRDRAKIVRRGMSGARRRYLGRLATKIELQAYEDWLGDFDDAKYDGLKSTHTIHHAVGRQPACRSQLHYVWRGVSTVEKRGSVWLRIRSSLFMVAATSVVVALILGCELSSLYMWHGRLPCHAARSPPHAKRCARSAIGSTSKEPNNI